MIVAATQALHRQRRYRMERLMLKFFLPDSPLRSY